MRVSESPSESNKSRRMVWKQWLLAYGFMTQASSHKTVWLKLNWLKGLSENNNGYVQWNISFIMCTLPPDHLHMEGTPRFFCCQLFWGSYLRGSKLLSDRALPFFLQGCWKSLFHELSGAATKLFRMSHRIGWENDMPTIVTMDPCPKTTELSANKIQWN